MNPTVQRWLKRGMFAALVIVVVGVGALECLRFVAIRRGVSAVELPPASEIRRRAFGAHYTDAYSTVIRDDAMLDAVEFGAGREVARTPDEVVWQGNAPGLHFLASYHIDPGPPRRFTLSTAVFYESVIGRIYFLPVRFVHRRGVPFMVSHMLRPKLEG